MIIVLNLTRLGAEGGAIAVSQDLLYPDAVLEDGDLEHILLALKNVAEARRNLINAANEPDLDWENCYQLLAQGETPTLQAIVLLLSKLGLKLSVTVKQEQTA